MKRTNILLLGLLALASATLHAKTKVALIAGRDSHGANAHNWGDGVDLLANALNKESGLPVEAVVSKLWPKDGKFFDDVKTIVILSDGGGGHPVIPHLDQVTELMAKGIGFVCVHYAVEVPKGDTGEGFLEWLGGYFETHWSVNPHWTADFKLIPGHPTTEGVKPFSLNDEWYYHMRFQPEGVTPILSALPPVDTLKRPDGPHSGNPDVRKAVLERKEKQHVAWAYQRPGNKGRGFGITGAHNHSSWDNDSFRTLVLNAIVWTAGMEVPKGGVKSLPNPTKRKSAQSTPTPSGTAGLKEALASTKTITTKTPGMAADISADIKGKKDLFLVIVDGEDKTCDWADWAEPRLIDADGKATKLTDLKWRSASSGWGSSKVNANAQGKPMKIDGKDVPYGIGTHAPSVIHYQLPEGHKFVKFEARGGLDDGGAKQSNGEAASVAFYVMDKAPATSALRSAPAGSVAEAGHPAFLPVDKFAYPEDLELTIWAKSPLFWNPTNIDIDHLGRIWVAEGRNYRGRRGSQGGDRIVVVQDTNGDGTADDSHVFVQETSFLSPLGIAVVDNKIIVSQPPDLIVYTDVNRNAVFDEGTDTREVLLTGFNGANHDHSLHSVTVGPNGQWYFNHGNMGSKVTDKEGWTLNAGSFYSMQQVSGHKSSDGQVYVGGVAMRVNPDGTGLRPIGYNFRNSYEQTVSSFGDVFQNDNDDPPASRTAWLMEYGNMGYASRNGTRNWGTDRMPGQETPVAEWRQEDPGTVPAGDVYGGGSPTGIAFYENGIMENKLSGYVLSCEPARNTVFGYHPAQAGAGIGLPKRDIFLTSNPEGNFAGADFRNAGGNAGEISLFRPSDVCIGPDGAIYVADWFDYRVGGHGTRDQAQTGTIYRLAPKGAKLKVPKLDLSNAVGQIAALKSPSPNVRELGRAKLEAVGAKSVPAVKALLEDSNPYIQARAIWLLAKLGDAGIQTVEGLLTHKDPQIRIAAFRALRHGNHKVLEHAAKLAKDPAPSVRREVALALRYVAFKDCEQILLDLAKGYDGKDRYYVEAFGIGATDKEEKTYAALKALRCENAGFDPVYANLVWRLQPVSALPELEAWAMDTKLDAATRRAMLFSISLIEAPQAAKSMVKVAKAAEGETGSLAKAFLDKRNQGIWSKYKPLDLYNGKPAEPIVYTDRLAPDSLGPDTKLPPANDILALKPDVENGKLMAGRCIMCHKIGATGVEFGPVLSGWGRGQTREIILRSILEPSADLSHGFEATELVVKGNKRLQGFMQAEGDPLVIRVFGGEDVVVEAADLVSRKKLKTSLMPAGSKFGLKAQHLRDIVEYLKVN